MPLATVRLVQAYHPSEGARLADIPPSVVAAVQRLLDHAVDPAAVEWLEGRSTVVAVRRPDGSEVVIKWSAWHQVLFAEWTALALIGDLGLDPPLAPRLLGGDVDAAVIVMERLPRGPSLAALLLGTDREAAKGGLVAVGRALGRLHSATIGRSAEYEVRRAALGPTKSVRYHVVRRLPELLARVDRWIEQGSFLRPKGLDDDLQRVRQAMIRPGPFLAVVHGDACPDNNRIYGDTAVLLDFQVAAIDHCLLDGAYFTVPFPTCWCVGQLDGSVGQAATDAYRQELAAGLPQINDDKFWMSSLAEATACWFLLRGIPGLRPALATDELWGTATMAQRLIQRSSRFAILPARPVFCRPWRTWPNSYPRRSEAGGLHWRPRRLTQRLLGPDKQWPQRRPGGTPRPSGSVAGCLPRSGERRRYERRGCRSLVRSCRRLGSVGTRAARLLPDAPPNRKRRTPARWPRTPAMGPSVHGGRDRRRGRPRSAGET